jgi:O-antigen ligase
MGAIERAPAASHTPLRSFGGDSGAPPSKRPTIAENLKIMAGAFFWVEMFFILYLIRPEDWIPGLHVIPVAKVVGVFAIVALILSMGQIKQGIPREVYYLCALVMIMGVSGLFSPVWRGGAVQQAENFGKVAVIVLVMALSVTTMPRLRRLIFLQAACTGIVVIASLIVRHEMEGRLAGVLNGIYQNPNDLALAIDLTFPFCFVFFLRARNPFRKSVWAATMLVMIVALLLTASRGGLIGIVIGAGGCVWGFGVRQKRVLLVVFAVVAAFIMVPVAGKLALQRLQGTFNPSEDIASAYASAQARKELLDESIKLSLEHPLFGVGAGDFQVLSGWHETHDVYTEWSAEVGIPALIVFLMIFYRAFRNVRDARQDAADRSDLAMFTSAARIDLTVFAFASFFYPVAYNFFVYFLFAYATALHRIASSGVEPVREKVDTRHHPGALRLQDAAKSKTVWTT